MENEAHTIKGILGGLEGTLYTVRSGIEQQDWDRIRLGWEMTEGYLEQISGLVENILGYAKADGPRKQPVEPGALLEQLASRFADRADLAGAALEQDIAPELPSVELDLQMMEASLATLLANAVDACAWDPATDKAHRISLVARSGTEGGVILEVVDNGAGISEENQRKILAGRFTTKGIRGTGLGLMLARKAVQAHGGRLSYESSPGEGSTFRIQLP